MRHSFLTALLAACRGTQLASAAALPQAPSASSAPALPLSAFDTLPVHLLTLDEVKAIAQNNLTKPPSTHSALVAATASTCTSPRVRTEWDSLDSSGRQAFVDALKCLMGKPASGQYSQAKSRYEDFVALHQTLTDNVHNNSKFLIWHRYLVWVFEEVLRSECGYGGALPWFDETRYAGNFPASSIFSDQWFGGVAASGNCITNGQFANLVLNVGPGTGNGAHCLARDNDNSQTINTGSSMVDNCNAATDYASMASCAEGGAHAWGHNGIGAVMKDVYASPGDPVFWLHHGFIDRNYRIWQNADSNRVNYIDGTDHVGNTLTLSTSVSVNGIRANVVISDIINTLGGVLCYKYNY